jgi:hypothetical protein
LKASQTSAQRSIAGGFILFVWVLNPHFGQPYAENLNQAYEELQELVERVNVELSFVEVMDQLEAEVGQ